MLRLIWGAVGAYLGTAIAFAMMGCLIYPGELPPLGVVGVAGCFGLFALALIAVAEKPNWDASTYIVAGLLSTGTAIFMAGVLLAALVKDALLSTALFVLFTSFLTGSLAGLLYRLFAGKHPPKKSEPDDPNNGKGPLVPHIW